MIQHLGASRGARTEWDGFVAQHAGATCYELQGWAEVAARAYEIPAYLLVSRAYVGAPIRGVLPLFVVPRLGRRYVTTGLFGAYGAHATTLGSPEARAELLEEAKRVTEATRATHLHVKALASPVASLGRGFVRHEIWARAVLPLDGGAEGAWRRAKPAVRAQVRQAKHCGLEPRVGHDQLEPFYDVLAENMHRKGAPIYGMQFMRALLDTFAERAQLVTLWLGRRAVAGALTLRFNGVVTVPFASARPAYFRLRPNNLLYWYMIERAANEGARAFDFGSSLADTTALAFKRGWGARVEPIHSHVYARGAQPILAPAHSSAVNAAIRLWRALPRGAADALGPWVCRSLA